MLHAHILLLLLYNYHGGWWWWRLWQKEQYSYYYCITAPRQAVSVTNGSNRIVAARWVTCLLSLRGIASLHIYVAQGHSLLAVAVSVTLVVGVVSETQCLLLAV